MLLDYHILLHFDLQLRLIDCGLYVAGGLLPLLAALAPSHLRLLTGLDLVMDWLDSLLFLMLCLARLLSPLVVEVTLMLDNIEATICRCQLFTLRDSLLAMQGLT